MSKSKNRNRWDRGDGGDPTGLWHVRRERTLALGCQNCFFKRDCGGLEIGSAFYNCLDFCECSDATKCDNVCPKRPESFAARLSEISGFGLEDIESAPPIPVQAPPRLVPLILHGFCRDRALQYPSVSIPLHKVMDFARSGARFRSRSELLDAFRLAPDSQLILSGTHSDPVLEKWWALDTEHAVGCFRELGVNIVTTPNYSLFSNVPRHDNLFNLKRIAKAWSEIQRGGIACALHLNARTDTDWKRWTRFLVDHPEIELVAFEFGTGAGYRLRIDWHVKQLETLANCVGRPLRLLVRGGIHVASRLERAFAGVTLLDTRPFLKTIHRQAAVPIGNRLRWYAAPTPPDAPLDSLLEANVAAIVSSMTPATNADDELPAPAQPDQARSGKPRSRRSPGVRLS